MKHVVPLSLNVMKHVYTRVFALCVCNMWFRDTVHASSMTYTYMGINGDHGQFALYLKMPTIYKATGCKLRFQRTTRGTVFLEVCRYSWAPSPSPHLV